MILIKRRSVVLTMPHRKLKAVGKAQDTDMEIAAHAIA